MCRVEKVFLVEERGKFILIFNCTRTFELARWLSAVRIMNLGNCQTYSSKEFGNYDKRALIHQKFCSTSLKRDEFADSFRIFFPQEPSVCSSDVRLKKRQRRAKKLNSRFSNEGIIFLSFAFSNTMETVQLPKIE